MSCSNLLEKVVFQNGPIGVMFQEAHGSLFPLVRVSKPFQKIAPWTRRLYINRQSLNSLHTSHGWNCLQHLVLGNLQQVQITWRCTSTWKRTLKLISCQDVLVQCSGPLSSVCFDMCENVVLLTSQPVHEAVFRFTDIMYGSPWLANVEKVRAWWSTHPTNIHLLPNWKSFSARTYAKIPLFLSLPNTPVALEHLEFVGFDDIRPSSFTGFPDVKTFQGPVALFEQLVLPRVRHVTLEVYEFLPSHVLKVAKELKTLQLRLQYTTLKDFTLDGCFFAVQTLRIFAPRSLQVTIANLAISNLYMNFGPGDESFEKFLCRQSTVQLENVVGLQSVQCQSETDFVHIRSTLPMVEATNRDLMLHWMSCLWKKFEELPPVLTPTTTITLPSLEDCRVQFQQRALELSTEIAGILQSLETLRQQHEKMDAQYIMLQKTKPLPTSLQKEVRSLVCSNFYSKQRSHLFLPSKSPIPIRSMGNTETLKALIALLKHFLAEFPEFDEEELSNLFVEEKKVHLEDTQRRQELDAVQTHLRRLLEEVDLTIRCGDTWLAFRERLRTLGEEIMVRRETLQRTCVALNAIQASILEPKPVCSILPVAFATMKKEMEQARNTQQKIQSILDSL